MTSDLERRIVELERQNAWMFEQFQMFRKKVNDIHEAHRVLHENAHRAHKEAFEQLSKLRLNGNKYDQAYYKVFPERLEPDLKMLEQLDAIKAKLKDDKAPDS